MKLAKFCIRMFLIQTVQNFKESNPVINDLRNRSGFKGSGKSMPKVV
jgi:hypothetical protein